MYSTFAGPLDTALALIGQSLVSLAGFPTLALAAVAGAFAVSLAGLTAVRTLARPRELTPDVQPVRERAIKHAA
jgi:hypothetical protein